MTAGTLPSSIDTVVIGAGQAGLAIGQQLATRGHEFVILDGLDRIGDNWRRHYDSLRLYSAACLDGLPGMRFPATRYHYPTRDEVADFLASYAARFDLPVRSRMRVDEVAPDDGRYVVRVGDQEIRADNVVVATGTFGHPHRPSFAAQVDPAITQLHSTEYHRPSDLPPGPVLVVGASHSGADVALEAATSGHPTTLVGRRTGQVPFDIEGPARRVMSRVFPFVATRVLSLSTPVGRKARRKIRAHGAPLLRVRDQDLAAAGVERVIERVAGVVDGRPVLDGGRRLDPASIVWCTGFRQDFSWIRLPVVGDDGWPREHRGVVAEAPGLYFMGLAFQSSFGSMLFVGVGRDARYVAKHLLARSPGRMRGRTRADEPSRAM